MMRCSLIQLIAVLRKLLKTFCNFVVTKWVVGSKIMLYASLRIAVRGFFSFFYRWKVEGVHHIPEEGPVVICANHISNLDPPLLGAAVQRKVHFMAKQELFLIPLFSLLIRALGAF